MVNPKVGYCESPWATPRGGGPRLQDRLDLGGENQLLGCPGRVIERLLAAPVPRQHELSGSLIVERESEHAVEPSEHVSTPALPTMDNHLCIRVGLEHVAHPGELAADGGEVADLTVEADPNRAVLVGHGHMPLRAEVLYGEPPAAQRGAPVARHPFTGIVRPPVCDRIGHPPNRLRATRLRLGGYGPAAQDSR